jgi:hypothetical protein
MFGFPWAIEPETFTDKQVRDALRGAAGEAEKVRDSAPCDEHRKAIDEAVERLKGVAEEIDQVRGPD